MRSLFQQFMVFKKTFSLDISRSFLAIKMLFGCDISHLIGGIHNFVSSTKKILYDIREQRYNQIKMEYQILKILFIRHS